LCPATVGELALPFDDNACGVPNLVVAPSLPGAPRLGSRYGSADRPVVSVASVHLLCAGTKRGRIEILCGARFYAESVPDEAVQARVLADGNSA